MEQSYAEATVAKKTSVGVVVLKILWIAVIVIFTAMFRIFPYALIIAVTAGAFLIWYWPRFKKSWEYVVCDGQLDFDMILGGEKRKHILRIEIENADVIAPMESSALDGYRHLPVKNFSSMNAGAKIYGIATRLPKQQDKVLIVFEPNERILKLMKDKCPNIVKEFVS